MVADRLGLSSLSFCYGLIRGEAGLSIGGGFVTAFDRPWMNGQNYTPHGWKRLAMNNTVLETNIARLFSITEIHGSLGLVGVTAEL